MLEMQMCHIISDITFSPPFLCPIRFWRSHKYTRSYRWASRVMLPLLYQAEGWKAIPNRKLKSKVIGLHLHDHDVGTLNLNFETILDSRHFLHLFRDERSMNLRTWSTSARAVSSRFCRCSSACLQRRTTWAPQMSSILCEKDRINF